MGYFLRVFQLCLNDKVIFHLIYQTTAWGTNVKKIELHLFSFLSFFSTYCEPLKEQYIYIFDIICFFFMIWYWIQSSARQFSDYHHVTSETKTTFTWRLSFHQSRQCKSKLDQCRLDQSRLDMKQIKTKHWQLNANDQWRVLPGKAMNTIQNDLIA